MNIVELPWPIPSPGLEVSIPSTDVTVAHFTTPATLGTKSGYISAYPGNASGSWTAIWPFDGALNNSPGDLTTSLPPGTAFAEAMGPDVFFRGVETPPHGAPMLQLLPSTDYYFNLSPVKGCPNPNIGVRFNLVAPRA